jgi:hypothetical protein
MVVLKEATKTHNKDNRLPDRESNPGAPDCEAADHTEGLFSTQVAGSVPACDVSDCPFRATSRGRKGIQ